jgi:hypothetical protein
MRIARTITSDVELNYDKDGNAKSVQMPYAIYKQLCDAKKETNGLRKIRKDDSQDGSSALQSVWKFRKAFATGHYTNGGAFCVRAGSKAKASMSATFNKLEDKVRTREQLIKDGTLIRKHEHHDYEFSRDCYFNSRSFAACIIDGNSRSDGWDK